MGKYSNQMKMLKYGVYLVKCAILESCEITYCILVRKPVPQYTYSDELESNVQASNLEMSLDIESDEEEMYSVDDLFNNTPIGFGDVLEEDISIDSSLYEKVEINIETPKPVYDISSKVAEEVSDITDNDLSGLKLFQESSDLETEDINKNLFSNFQTLKDLQDSFEE